MRWALPVLVAAACVGCAYHNPSSPTAIERTAPLTAASIRLTAASRVDRGLDVLATVLSSDGRFVSGVVVGFSSSAGSLSSASATSAADGTARTTLTSSTNAQITAAGAGVTASIGVLGVPGPFVPPVSTPQPAPTPESPITLPTPPLRIVVSGNPWPGGVLNFTVTPATSAQAVWTFGDGSDAATSTLTNGLAAHAYAATGSNPVSVTVTNTAGSTSTATGVVGIITSPGVTPILALTCSSAARAVPITCTLSVTDQNGVSLASAAVANSARWNWADGDASVGYPGLTGGYTYNVAGTYTLLVFVDVNGRSAAVSKTFTIT